MLTLLSIKYVLKRKNLIKGKSSIKLFQQLGKNGKYSALAVFIHVAFYIVHVQCSIKPEYMECKYKPKFYVHDESMYILVIKHIQKKKCEIKFNDTKKKKKTSRGQLR